MPEENLQSSNDMQNIEEQLIVSEETGDNHPEPVDEQEFVPVEDIELEAIEDQELEPVEEQEFNPVEEQKLEPMEEPEIEVSENQELETVEEEPELVEETELESVEEPELETMEEPELETDSGQIDIEDETSDIDYGSFTRKEMMDHLRKLLVLGEIDIIRRDIDILKYHFYRKLKAEEELKRAEYIENGGSDDDYVFE